MTKEEQPKVSIPFAVVVTVIIAVSAWLMAHYQASAAMSEKFVTKEQYRCDLARVEARIESGFSDLGKKVDRLLFRNGER